MADNRYLKPPVFSPGGRFADRFLPVVFLATSFIGLVSYSIPVWGIFFYFTVIPLVLLKVIQDKKRPYFRDIWTLSVLLLLLWSGFNVLIGHNPGGYVYHSAGQWIAEGFCTSFFILGAVLSAENGAKFERLFRKFFVAGAVFNAAASLGQMLVSGHFSGRLQGWSVTFNPVLGAAINGFAFLLALDLFFREKTLRRFWYLGACLILLIFVLLTGSRTGLATVFLMTSVRLALLSKKERRYVVPALLGLAALIIAIGRHLLEERLHEAFHRGTDYHVLLWKLSLKEIAKHPFTGFGPSAGLPINLPFLFHPFPQNLFLSVLFYSGIIGLVLFLTGLIILFFRVWRLPDLKERVIYLSFFFFPLLIGITDISQINKAPAAVWYVLWAPLLICFCKTCYWQKTAEASEEIRVENRN